MSVSRWYEDQRQYFMSLSTDSREAILKCEEQGVYDSPEYQEAMMTYYKQHVCRLEPWPECLEASMSKLGHDVYEFMWGHSEFTITGTLQTYERALDLWNISIPTLFTCGRYDEASPISTEYYHSMLPGSTMVIYEDASHTHHLEQKAAYLETIREFLSSVEKPEKP